MPFARDMITAAGNVRLSDFAPNMEKSVKTRATIDLLKSMYPHMSEEAIITKLRENRIR